MDKPPPTAGPPRAARRPGRDEDTGGTVKTVPYGGCKSCRRARKRGAAHVRGAPQDASYFISAMSQMMSTHFSTPMRPLLRQR